MTNYEKYKDEILKHGPSGFGMKDGNIVACCDITCSVCYFSVNPTCDSSILDWLFEECIEKPVLTEQEYIMCLLLKDGYLTKVNNGTGNNTNIYYSKSSLLNNGHLIDLFSELGKYAVITSLCNLIGADFDFIIPNSEYSVSYLLDCKWMDE